MLAVERFTWCGCRRRARVRVLAAYKDLLTLWKDADPDIPILKEAKAEFAKLQQLVQTESVTPDSSRTSES